MGCMTGVLILYVRSVCFTSCKVYVVFYAFMPLLSFLSFFSLVFVNVFNEQITTGAFKC